MKVISELGITDNTKLKLSIGEFRGSERVDLRQYFKVDSEWIPQFIEMVDKLREL